MSVTVDIRNSEEREAKDVSRCTSVGSRWVALGRSDRLKKRVGRRRQVRLFCGDVMAVVAHHVALTKRLVQKGECRPHEMTRKKLPGRSHGPA